MPPVCCFATRLRRAVTLVGLSHASRVMALVRSSDGLSGIRTIDDVPLNWSAPPYFPVLVHVPFCTVPLFPLPDRSFSVAPAPSSNEYAATGPFAAGAGAGCGEGAGTGTGAGSGVGDGAGAGC